MSMLAISCATIVLVKAEGRVLGRAVDKVYSHTILWVIKSVTQESEWRTSSLRKEFVKRTDAGYICCLQYCLLY